MASFLKYRIQLAGLWPALLLFASCSQISLKQDEINAALYRGDINAAYNILNTDEKKWERNRNALLYYWNKGNLAFLLGKHQESSEIFKKGDYFLEDIYKNYANEAAALFTNDKIKQYTGEDHERILFHYYQIINFMQLGNTENALVQARRLQLELQRLEDRSKKRVTNKNTYWRDAFAYVLIGLVYESAGQEELAFVAYKRAYFAYKEDYAPNYGVNMPDQFKHDLLRLSYRLGHEADLAYFEKDLGVKYDLKGNHEGGNTVIFWNAGLAPRKYELSLSFMILPGNAPGYVIFSNNEYGFYIPVFVGVDHTQNGSAFSQLKFIRGALPKYANRGSLYTHAFLRYGNDDTPFETLQNISAIAEKELNDRYLEEVGKVLLRVALKKASEIELRKNQPEAGAALGIMNFITERADTRSWESMPHQISYVRQNLKPGKQQITFSSFARGYQQSFTKEVEIPAQGLYLDCFHTVQPAKIVR